MDSLTWRPDCRSQITQWADRNSFDLRIFITMTLTHGLVASKSNYIHSFTGAVSASLSSGGHGVIGSWRVRSHVTPVSQCEGGALTAVPDMLPASTYRKSASQFTSRVVIHVSRRASERLQHTYTHARRQRPCASLFGWEKNPAFVSWVCLFCWQR